MDRAVLLIQHDKDFSIASILIASKSCKSLRYGLKRFNEKFITVFSKILDEERKVGEFEETREIVNNVFDFIPSYKEVSKKK